MGNLANLYIYVELVINMQHALLLVMEQDTPADARTVTAELEAFVGKKKVSESFNMFAETVVK